MSILRLTAEDNVAIALCDLTPGTQLSDGLTICEAIPSGHKVALHSLVAGDVVKKYGAVIGQAHQPIAAGSHVHVHNLAYVSAASNNLARTHSRIEPSPVVPRHFQGFHRPDGQIGTRNYIGIITTVNCSASVARRIAARFGEDVMADFDHVDGVAAFTHQSGCGMGGDGEGAVLLQRTLAGYARHANFHSVVLIGLGCEVTQIDRVRDQMGLSPSIDLHSFTIQEVGGTSRAIEHGAALVAELLRDANTARRQPAPLSALKLGLQCGGSDGWSGVTANPALGVASDLLVAHGGTAILSETPEIYGAEALLLARAQSPEIADKLNARLAWWQNYVAKHGASLDNNPSPGNKQGGLTTILEKSLGAVAKSGSSLLRDVYGYGETITTPGFVFMDSPGYDPCSATGQIAAGANLIAFTTGRGSVFGSKPAPCLKLASNEALSRHMDEDIDVDCSPILSGASLADMGGQIFEALIDTASGKPTRSEALGLGDEEFVPWQIGAFL